MKMLFEYAVLLDDKMDKEGNVVEEGEIVVQPTVVRAADESQAGLLAARAIPDEYVANGKFDRLQVVVRPF